MQYHHRLPKLRNMLVRFESQMVRVQRPRDHIVEPRQIAEQPRHRMRSNLLRDIVERRLQHDGARCHHIALRQHRHHVRGNAGAQRMAPHVHRILGVLPHVLVQRQRIAHDAPLRRRCARRVAVAAIVERQHVIAQPTQQLVDLHAMRGAARIRIAVQIQHDLGGRFAQLLLVEALAVRVIDALPELGVERRPFVVQMVGQRLGFGDDARIVGGQIQGARVAFGHVMRQNVPDAEPNAGARFAGQRRGVIAARGETELLRAAAGRDGRAAGLVIVVGVRFVVGDDEIARGKEAELLGSGKVEILRVGDWAERRRRPASPLIIIIRLCNSDRN